MKYILLSTPNAYLEELRFARIAQHIQNLTLETVRSGVEHAVSRFQFLAKHGGQHIEHVLHCSHKI